MLKKDGNDILFIHNNMTYQLADQPYEPCLYIRKDGKDICTLHNAFTVYDLPDFFAQGKSLLGIDGKMYDETAFVNVIHAAIDSGRSEMDFPFAAGLVK